MFPFLLPLLTGLSSLGEIPEVAAGLADTLGAGEVAAGTAAATAIPAAEAAIPAAAPVIAPATAKGGVAALEAAQKLAPAAAQAAKAAPLPGGLSSLRPALPPPAMMSKMGAPPPTGIMTAKLPPVGPGGTPLGAPPAPTPRLPMPRPMATASSFPQMGAPPPTGVMTAKPPIAPQPSGLQALTTAPKPAAPMPPARLPTARPSSFGASATPGSNLAAAPITGGVPPGSTSKGLGGMLGNLKTSDLILPAMLGMTMMQSGGGGSSGGDEDNGPPQSDIHYDQGDVNTPPDSYQPGTDPEFDYFNDSYYHSSGMAQGGMVGDQGGNGAQDQALIMETVKALQGQSPNAQEVISTFIKVFGPEALKDLMAKLGIDGGGAPSDKGGIASQLPAMPPPPQSMPQMPPMAPPQPPMGGKPIMGPGNGMSDSIPATVNGKQPTSLSNGEFVVPSDVVSGIGNGSTDAGAGHLYDMMNRVRDARTGSPTPPNYMNPRQALPV